MGRPAAYAFLLLSAWVAPVFADVPAEGSAQGATSDLREDERHGVRLGDLVLRPQLQVRLRGEGRGNPVDVGVLAPPPGAGPRADRAGGGLSRVRVGLDAEISVFRARAIVQDARVFGGPDGGAVLGDPGAASTGLYEGFLEAHAKERQQTFFRAGRQAVQWGDGRLIGAQDWSVRGRSLDAVRGNLWLGSRFHVEALGALLAAPAPAGVPLGQSFGSPKTGRALFGALAGFDVHPLLRFELLGLGRVTDAPASDPSRTQSLDQVHAKSQLVTTSLRVFGAEHGWAYSAEGALQGGRAELPTGSVPVFAFAAAGKVSRRVDELLLSPEPELGISYASGDARGSRLYTQFDPILPNPIAYGLIDAATWSNSVSVHASLALHLHERVAVVPTYRYLAFASASGDWIGGTLQPISNVASDSRTLGHELDLLLRWTPHRVFEARAGGALLVLGQGGKDRLPGAAESVRPYGLVQLQLNVD